MKLSLDPPRWKNGPPICREFNLPHFATRAEMKAFRESFCGVAAVEWKCPACSGWHYWQKPRPPSGDSSNTGRHYRAPSEMRRKILLALTLVPIDKNTP